MKPFETINWKEIYDAVAEYADYIKNNPKANNDGGRHYLENIEGTVLSECMTDDTFEQMCELDQDDDE